MAAITIHTIAIVLAASSLISNIHAIRWQHSTHLDPNFRLLWNVDAVAARITIELQVRTHGYVGIGFARNSAANSDDSDYRAGADMTIGWVADGQTYLQDRHYKSNGAGEPRIDAVDDCTLLLGYENATHTVLRFERALETCDRAHDVPITNHTMRVLYMYHELEPWHGSVAPGALPKPNAAFRGAVPLLLGQRQHHEQHHLRRGQHLGGNAIDEDEENDEAAVYTIDLRNEDVPLPVPGESLQWCNMFELNDFRTKHHMVQFEPVFGSTKAARLLDRMVLYECQGSSVRLSAMARDAGRQCHHSRQSVPCNAVVASWTRGSEGFAFPAEAGIPFESSKERFYLMESHYRHHIAEDWELADLTDSANAGPFVDDSGLRLHVTTALRRHDAGVMSVGMQPDWRHIIPPGQETVTSEGHCVDSCTRSAFPAAGIRIFALLMRTHSIGKSVRLRQIRGHEELLPIAEDASVHSDYAEYRRIEPAARVLPGDSMVVECQYDSTARETITVGGGGGQGGGQHGETCNVLAVYYPRQKKLTTCHSLPALPTVLQSLGIEALMPSDSQSAVQIAAPSELAGMTLETRLLGYDWAQNFGIFESVTRAGAFQAICRDARKKTVLGTDKRLYRTPTVRRILRPAVSQRRSKCMMEPASRMDDVRRLFDASNDIDATTYEVYEVQSMGLSGSAAGQRTSMAGGVSAAVLVAAAVWLRQAIA